MVMVHSLTSAPYAGHAYHMNRVTRKKGFSLNASAYLKLEASNFDRDFRLLRWQ